MSTHTNAHMSTQRGLGQSTKYADEHRCSNALLAKVMQADIESRCSNAVLAANDADSKGAQMTDRLSEAEIEYWASYCFEAEEDDDYPTDEEITEILAEIYREQDNDTNRN